MKNLSIILFAGFILAAGCQRAQNDNKLDELANKLDTIEKKVDKLSAARPGAAARPERKRPTPGALYKVPVADADPFRGGKHAKVTVVEAYEFACPYCKMLSPVMDKLLEHYDDADLKIVSKQFVVHPQVATEPALAVCAANRQGKFGDYEVALWKTAWKGDDRPQLDRTKLTREQLVGLAKSLGMDGGKFEKDMASPDCQQELSRQRKELAMLGVNGTPAVYINGNYYAGQRSFDAMKAAIDQEIAKADKALQGGAKLEGYYTSLVAKGKPTL